MATDATAGPGRAPAPQEGRVAPHVEAELPGLGIAWIELEGGLGKSSPSVLQRLRDVSDRFYGAQALRMRERPIPWAYRTFYRQIGLDPDETRTPVEQLALERLQSGGFKSRGLPEDALTVATVETGVALCCFDAERLEGGLCIRDALPGESLGGGPAELTPGTLVVADESTPVALLFGEAGEGHGVGRETRRLAIAAIRVAGVPQLAADEALWTALAVACS